MICTDNECDLFQHTTSIMADDKPKPPMRSATSPNPPPSSAARHRLSQRQPSEQNASQSPKPSLGRRRSSVISYSSFEDLTQTLTDDLINPSFTRPRTAKEDDEVTHWHSTPLAFAILPAIGGLLFKNGSAFVTDVLLLVLAAIFMNWSIRLPWDWYYSAQAQRRDVEAEYGSFLDGTDTDETAVESASSVETLPKRASELDDVPEEPGGSEQLQKGEDAATELRRQEKLALLATFIFPVLAAYLLHIIRAQLSASSGGLVSDYNLTIFLLAAEVRPCRQLIRLITDRTLHLQRTVTGLNDPFGSAVEEKSAFSNLTSRIAELEAKLSEHTVVPQTMTIAQKTDVSELSAEMKKRYEPRLEGLERAVRRYEKRSTTLAMLTEQRLGSLETRLQDALSLAAVAAQQSQRRGVLRTLLDNIAVVILWPLKLAYRLAMSPLHLIDEAYTKLKGLLVGPTAPRPGRRSGSKQRTVKDDKVQKEKTPLRKVNR